MGISLKALLGVRAEGTLAKKTNLQPVVITQTMCVVLECFWSLHFYSSFYSGVTAKAGVCCHYLCENQDSFIGCSLVPSLPAAFTRVFVHSCKREFLVSTPSSASPVECLEHRGASKVPSSSSHWFTFTMLAQTWLFSVGVLDLELLCSAGASVGHLHICGWCSSAPDL